MSPPVSSPPAGSRRRLLLGQLVSNGDCLYATALARQIKHDEPACHLTWAVGTKCRAILGGNPHVDAIWEVPLASNAPGEVEGAWNAFREEALARRARGEFDEIFLTQIFPDHLHRYDGMIRSTILRGYPRPITVPITPVLRLTTAEIENVRSFAERHRLRESARVVLFECGPLSDQSFMSPAYALEFSRQLVAQIPEVCVILSSGTALDTGHPRIVDGSVLTFRENAELTRYCTLLVGCSSGITWLTTSEAAQPLPMVQLLNEKAAWFNSVRVDFEHWNLPTDQIIEIADRHRDRLLACVQAVWSVGFPAARARFHERLQRRFGFIGAVQRDLVRSGRPGDAARMLWLNVQAYGPRPELLLCHVKWAWQAGRRWLVPRLRAG